MQIFNLVESDEEEDNAEFSMINPNLLDFDLADGDSVSNIPLVSKIIGKLLLPNKEFYELCYQLKKRSTVSVQFYNTLCTAF